MPLKVLMFGWELPPFNSGGLGVACAGLTKALSEQGIEITFVLPKEVDLKINYMKVVFADIEFPCPDFSVYSLIKHGLLPPELHHGMLDAVLSYARRASEIAKHYPHDIIHAHDWLCIPAGIAASKSSGKPLVSQIHSTEYDRSAGLSINPTVFAFEKHGVKKSKSLITVSEFTANLLREHYAADPDKLNVVHNGINPEDFAGVFVSDPFLALKQAGFKIVIFVGRITIQKGPDYFLKAAQKVLGFHPDTIFVFAGSGDMENQMIELASSLGISHKVLFAGFLRGQTLKDAFKSADIFVMPSVSEPFGLVALEAVAFGTPAIISKQSGVSESLSHVLKADFWDIDEMTDQMVSILRNPALYKTLSTEGRQESRRNTWSKAASETIKVYKKTLKK